MNQYSILNAVIYELLIELIKIWPKLKLNQWIRAALNWCRADWVKWRTEQTLKDVDRQAQEIVKEWEAQEKPKYEIIEHKSDGSRAQDLLGGAMEIKSTWRRD
jgi:hypothetical protein